MNFKCAARLSCAVFATLLSVSSLAAEEMSGACPADTSKSSINHARWLADFEIVKEAIAARSPNLDWQVSRGLDLFTLSARTEAALSNAVDDANARVTLNRFIARFADGHMRLTWPKLEQNTTPPLRHENFCMANNYWDGADEFELARHLPGFKALSMHEKWIAAGAIDTSYGPVGVLRAPLFSPNVEHCEAALAELEISQGETCDEDCAEQVRAKADDLFLFDIRSAITAVQREEAVILLVDIADNGGGSDLSIATARMLAGNSVPTPRLGIDRTPERARDIQERITYLREAMSNASDSERKILGEYVSALDAALEDLSRDCGRQHIWSGAPAACSSSVSGPFYASGLTPRELDTDTRAKPWAITVSSTARYDYEPGLWKGDLAVLVDGGTASSAELFAAMLQDHGATVIGSPTVGASCGWNMARKTIELPYSGGRLDIPNCARFRRDGSNEIDGISPDVFVGFKDFDTATQRQSRLAARWPIIASTIFTVDKN